MSVRPEERRTAREYDRLMTGAALPGYVARALLGRFGTHVVNSPINDVPKLVDLGRQHRILDLGCGRAGLLALLSDQMEFDHRPVGVDISVSALELARTDAGAERPMELAAASATRLPFRDGSFDLVLAAHLMKHFDDESLFRLLLEVLRVLAPGGILLAWEFAPTSSRKLNSLHLRLLEKFTATNRLRGFGAIVPYALYAGFKHVDRVHFRMPFLFPPIPRVSVMLQKSREQDQAIVDEACAREMWVSAH
jgi:ubiquinone/menaquinone biosynthesis C-methylase UbiE